MPVTNVHPLNQLGLKGKPAGATWGVVLWYTINVRACLRGCEGQREAIDYFNIVALHARYISPAKLNNHIIAGLASRVRYQNASRVRRNNHSFNVFVRLKRIYNEAIFDYCLRKLFAIGQSTPLVPTSLAPPPLPGLPYLIFAGIIRYAPSIVFRLSYSTINLV